MNRLLNLLSVPKHQLRGIPNLEADVMNNVGPLLSETSLITANNYYFIKDRVTKREIKLAWKLGSYQ